MRFDEFRSQVEQSDPAEWRKVPSDGPTYRVRYGSIWSHDSGHRVEINEHHSVGVYTPDIDITLAFGLNIDFDYADDRHPMKRSFEWAAEAFGDPEISVFFADLFYRGALIDRVNYVLVDEFRVALPWAKEFDGLKASRFETAVARIVHNLLPSAEDFDAYFDRAGFKLE